MSRLLPEPQKSIFTPDDLLSGYGVGLLFDTYGKTFLFVGSMRVGDQTVPALAVSDWSKGGFIEAATHHEDFPIAPNAFMAVDDRYIHSKSEVRPVHALVDSRAISNLLSQIRLSRVDDLLPPVLDDLKQSVALPESRL